MQIKKKFIYGERPRIEENDEIKKMMDNDIFEHMFLELAEFIGTTLTHLFSSPLVDPLHFVNSPTGFMISVRQYPGYWQSIAHTLLSVQFPTAVDMVFNNVNYSAFFEKSPISDPNFLIRYLEMGIDPSISEGAYKSPMISEVELDAFFKELTAHRAIYEPVKPLPLQVDGIIYQDRAEFQVAKAYFYYEASQYV